MNSVIVHHEFLVDIQLGAIVTDDTEFVAAVLSDSKPGRIDDGKPLKNLRQIGKSVVPGSIRDIDLVYQNRRDRIALFQIPRNCCCRFFNDVNITANQFWFGVLPAGSPCPNKFESAKSTTITGKLNLNKCFDLFIRNVIIGKKKPSKSLVVKTDPGDLHFFFVQPKMIKNGLVRQSSFYSERSQLRWDPG